LIIFSYNRGEIPPFPVLLIILAISPSLPFVLASSYNRGFVTEADLAAASKGTSLGLLCSPILAVIFLFATDSTRLLQASSPVLIGIPLTFFGSAYLPYLALARVTAEKILSPENRKTVIARAYLPPESLLVLILSVLTRASPPRRVILRAFNSTLIVLVFPLSLGWLLIARTAGPLSWVFPPIYYSLLILVTRNNLSHLGREDAKALEDALRNVETPPGPSTGAELAWTVLVFILYAYFLISILKSTFS